MANALICPQCNAPLKPSKFERTLTCSYCGTTIKMEVSTSMSAETFHQAYRSWNDPQSYSFSTWFSIVNAHWAVGDALGNGAICDVFNGKRARFPTELVILKVLRDPRDISQLDNEWEALQALQESSALGAETFARLLPIPVMHGKISAGTFEGRHVNIFRWAAGFQHTFNAVRQVYPQGIPPRASIWVWRRILEVLAFIHNSGMVHGAVLPAHLLVQDNEHGVRLIGYGSAGTTGKKLRFLAEGYESFYPNGIQAGSTLTPQLDLVMSARCLATLLGGIPTDASLPEHVPAPLARLIQRVALSNPADPTMKTAWALHEELGSLARAVFGAPQFNPIVMPT